MSLATAGKGRGPTVRRQWRCESTEWPYPGQGAATTHKLMLKAGRYIPYKRVCSASHVTKGQDEALESPVCMLSMERSRNPTRLRDVCTVSNAR